MSESEYTRSAFGCSLAMSTVQILSVYYKLWKRFLIFDMYAFTYIITKPYGRDIFGILLVQSFIYY